MPIQTEFVLIAEDTEMSHMLKNTWLASLAMVPSQLSSSELHLNLHDLPNTTHNMNLETSDIWLSIGEVKYWK